jgi:hypothetical protein
MKKEINPTPELAKAYEGNMKSLCNEFIKALERLKRFDSTFTPDEQRGAEIRINSIVTMIKSKQF